MAADGGDPSPGDSRTQQFGSHHRSAGFNGQTTAGHEVTADEAENRHGRKVGTDLRAMVGAMGADDFPTGNNHGPAGDAAGFFNLRALGNRGIAGEAVVQLRAIE